MGVKNVKMACIVDNGNTGVGSCWNDVGVPRGIIFVPKGKTYTTTSISAFIAALLPDLLADDPTQRAYPVQNIVEVTDSTTKPNVQTFPGDGSQIIAGENAYTMQYRWYDGGFCLHYSLRQSKGQTKAFFIIDSKGQLIGTDGGTDLIKGIVGYNYTEPFTWATTNAAVATYQTMLSFRPEQVNENMALLDFSENGGLGYLSSLNGLFNVDITQAAAPTATTVTVKAQVMGCDSQDLYELYSTDLAVPGAWNVENAATGGTIVVSGVAKSATYAGWVLTLTAANGLTVNVSLVGPTELDALSVTGFASNSLSQVIPAS